MWFFSLKITHVVGAAILFGMIMQGIAESLLILLCKKLNVENEVDRQVLFDTVALVMSLLVQPITGFLLLSLHQYTINQSWPVFVLLGYLLLGMFWLAAFYLRSRASVSLKKQPYIIGRLIMLVGALVTYLVMVYLMVALSIPK